MFTDYAETHRYVVETLMFYLPGEDWDEETIPDPTDFDEKAVDAVVHELLVDESITEMSEDDIINLYEEYLKLT